MTSAIEFIFNENVQYNQIKCNAITIELLKFKSYEWIKLFITDKHCIILEIIPDPTIDDNQLLLSNEILLKYNQIKNESNRYKFNFELINITNKQQQQQQQQQQHQSQTPTPISITLKKINSNYNGKIIIDTLKRYFSHKPLVVNCEYILPIVGNMCIFKTTNIKNNNNEEIQQIDQIENSYRIDEIIIIDSNNKNNDKDVDDIELIDIKEQAQQLIEFLNLKFKSTLNNNNNNNNNNGQFSFLSSKGILIDGPDGTNKLPLIKHVSKEYKSKYININDLIDNSNSGSNSNDNNSTNEPIIYIINNLDQMIGKITDNENSYQKKMVQRLSHFIDHMKSNEIILSTCSSIENIDQSITRAGRIDKFIHLSIPTQAKRILILSNILRNTSFKENNGKLIGQQSKRDEFILELSKITPGFLVKDLIKLCRTVSLYTISEEEEEESNNNDNTTTTTGIKFQTFKESLSFIKPSTLINFDVTVQNVKWESVGGYGEVKNRFKELIEWPMKYQDTFKRLSLNNSSGLLLYGPSGCGKSLMVKAIATEMSINFISVKGSDIYSKWLGESERIIRDLFKSARLSSPCIMFFDEIDSLTLSRDNDGDDTSGVSKRILSQLLNEMDGIQIKSQIFLIGCTNSIKSIDSALLRPGRLETLIHIDLPSLEDRIDILSVISKSLNFNSSEITPQDWLDIAKQTTNFTGSQLYNLCNQAGLVQLKFDPNSQSISKESLLNSLNKIKK